MSKFGRYHHRDLAIALAWALGDARESTDKSMAQLHAWNAIDRVSDMLQRDNESFDPHKFKDMVMEYAGLNKPTTTDSTMANISTRREQDLSKAKPDHIDANKGLSLSDLQWKRRLWERKDPDHLAEMENDNYEDRL